MSKTLKKFSNKRKKTQQRRKTKGRKPIRKKTIRNRRKTGGLRSASEDVKKEVNEIARLYYARPRTCENIVNVKNKLKLLAESKKRSCRVFGVGVMDWKDTQCEKNKEIHYVMAKRIASMIGLVKTSEKNQENVYKILEEKSTRLTEIDDGERIKKELNQIIQVENELHIIEIIELIKSNPNHYLKCSCKSRQIGLECSKNTSETKNTSEVVVEDEAKYKSELGLQRIVLDVLEKKYFDENNEPIHPLNLVDLSQSDDYISSETPLKKYRESEGGGKLTRTNESYLKSMRCSYIKAVEQYYALNKIPDTSDESCECKINKK